MNFEQFNLDSRLLAGIERLGYAEATPIQVAAIPAALEGKDIIGTAQTGTGKTAAFVLPILNKLLTGPRNCARALIVTPTRELAEQIHDAVKDLGTGTKIRCATIYGGVGAGPQSAPCATASRSWSPARAACWTISSKATPAWTGSRSSSWTRPTACSTWASCRM